MYIRSGPVESGAAWLNNIIILIMETLINRIKIDPNDIVIHIIRTCIDIYLQYTTTLYRAGYAYAITGLIIISRLRRDDDKTSGIYICINSSANGIAAAEGMGRGIRIIIGPMIAGLGDPDGPNGGGRQVLHGDTYTYIILYLQSAYYIGRYTSVDIQRYVIL